MAMRAQNSVLISPIIFLHRNEFLLRAETLQSGSTKGPHTDHPPDATIAKKNDHTENKLQLTTTQVTSSSLFNQRLEIQKKTIDSKEKKTTKNFQRQEFDLRPELHSTNIIHINHQTSFITNNHTHIQQQPFNCTTGQIQQQSCQTLLKYNNNQTNNNNKP